MSEADEHGEDALAEAAGAEAEAEDGSPAVGAQLRAESRRAKAPAKAAPKAAAKRGPGRPPSKPPAPPLDRLGVVASPNDPANRLEFVYEDPTIFKTLFTFFKNVKASNIHLRCNPAGLTFFAHDLSKKSRIVAHIAGEQVNWHYCEGEFWLGINRKHMEAMFASISKSFCKVTIVQTHDETESLSFIYKKLVLSSEKCYKMALSSYALSQELIDAELSLTPEALAANPIEFELDAKQFKQSISDAIMYSNTLTVEKIGSYPLQFTYAKPSIIYHEVFRDSDAIKLRTDINEAGTTFRCTMNLENIKPLATSMVTDTVRILCREEGDILFRSAIDKKALVVSVLTKLA